jgi:hypothetical protein
MDTHAAEQSRELEVDAERVDARYADGMLR